MPIDLQHGLIFEDLYSLKGIKKIDDLFLSFLEKENINLYSELILCRGIKKVEAKRYSILIVNIAPYVERFISKLFKVEKQLALASSLHNNFEEIAKCKRLFVQRQAVKKYKNGDWSGFDFSRKLLELEKIIGEFSEYNFAVNVNKWSLEKDKFQNHLELALEIAAWITFSKEGKDKFPYSILFSTPTKRDNLNLVKHNVKKTPDFNFISAEDIDIHSREDFSLSDSGPSLEKILDQAHYCIYCHNQDKDSCSKGLKEKSGQEGTYIKNEFDESLTGCPLEEKISEMNFLKANGFIIAPLVAAVIDNPLLAATGHRICNDCMKSCIYQKQDPVNIPQVESRVLSDVLELDWGFEIYSLLTRWNPINIDRPYPKEPTNKDILVVGLGPAGFNLSHHLLNDGHNICAIDGLKIEPLNDSISGINQAGERVRFEPIKRVEHLFDDLDKRTPQGFGGVAEYGITVRWNKNNLKLIRLLLERRLSFRMFGGVRFGGQINYSNTKNLGFDHLALAMGAGKPNLIDIPNIMSKGVRTASDFLMGIQLTGASREESFANMQIRLPVLVIGGGLTAVDAATESIAYYIRQVKKFSERHAELLKNYSKELIEKEWSEEDQIIANEFLSHAEFFEDERVAAVKENRKPNFVKITRKLGGVNIIYRKKFTQSPCYRLNPEEVSLALQEGIGFVESAVPCEVMLDNFRNVEKLKVKIRGETKILPTKTILLAVGTSPNTISAREDEDNFILDGKYFRAINEAGEIVSPERSSKPEDVFPITSIDEDKFAVSFFGDLHPSFTGNVVKAMASAKNGYKEVTRVLLSRPSKAKAVLNRMHSLLDARIEEVKILAPKIIEIIMYAPLAAENFQPGQFYRLQNFESNALSKDGLKLAMEGLAMTGAWVDKERSLISVIALEMGGSSDLCRHLKVGEPVVLMGPTGKPTEIKSNENVVLVGGGLGNAVLFSIGKAFKEMGSKVLYFAGYKKLQDVYKKDDIEAAADQVVWCCDEGIIPARREQDQSIYGNMVQAIEAYGMKKIHNDQFELNSISKIIAIGSDGMMNAINEARKGVISSSLPKNYKVIASINSPMQCMMKEICGQCIQKHVDPNTGLESYVYSCFNQDQDMKSVDFVNLRDRLSQNSLLEKQTKLWLDLTLKEIGLR